MLYLVSTPIGNLEEMSPRAIRVLYQSPLILVEKRSDCLKLLHHFGIRPKEVIRYDDASHKRIISTILKKLENTDAAYITSAGTPGVSDPGNRLVQAVRAAGIPISVVSGPSALTAAIAASGLPSPYLFIGFLEKKHSALQTALRNAASVKATLVFYESTHRIIKTLTALKNLLPNEQIFVGKELTKLHETMLYDTPTKILDIFAKNSALTRGEFVVMVPPAR